MAEQAKGAGEAQSPKSKGKLLVLIAALVLLLGGAGGYMMGLFGGAEAKQADHGEEAVETQAEDHATVSEPQAQLFFINLPDVLVNLQSEGKRPRFLKLRVALEVMGEETTNPVNELIPRIMDSFQLYLRALSPDDVEGAQGLQRLKEEMLARINFAIEPHRIESVLIKEMLVQ